MKLPKIKIPAGVTRALNKGLYQVKQHSPEILIVTGIVSGVAATVMACRASTKLNEVLEVAKDEVEAVRQNKEDGEVNVVNPDTGEVEMVPYTEQDYRKHMFYVYLRNGLRLGKLYGPAILLGTASIGCVLASNDIIRKRNVALAAAYTTLDNSFKEYRGRVIERFDEALDRELLYNIKTKEVEETVTNEDGTEQVVKRTVEVVEGPITSPYTVCFDETCTCWTKNAEDNKFFLLMMQNQANEKLKAEGFLFLNDVLKMIGARQTQAGQIVGWVYDKDNCIGDNYVDFGIFNIHSEASRNFVNGLERSIWLEFNVDGNIQKLLA